MPLYCSAACRSSAYRARKGAGSRALAPSPSPSASAPVAGELGWPQVWAPAPVEAPRPEPVGEDCEGGGRLFWSAGHTMRACEDGCTPEVPATLVPADRAGGVRRVPTRDEVLDDRLRLAGQRETLAAWIAERLTDGLLTPESRGHLRQFAGEVADAASAEALEWLARRLAALPLRTTEPPRPIAPLVIEAEPLDAELVDETGGALPVEPAPRMRALPAPRRTVDDTPAEDRPAVTTRCRRCRAPASCYADAVTPTPALLEFVGGSLPVDVCDRCAVLLGSAHPEGTWDIRPLLPWAVAR